MIPRKLRSQADKQLVKDHLLSLSERDRYLRFGGAMSNEVIERYVDDTWEGDNEWLGIVEDGAVIAAIHVALETETKAELGLSVNPDWRGKKLGQSLFERGMVYVRAQGVKDVFMHCLTENSIMKHIASKNHMKMFSSYGETDADLQVEPLPFDPIREVFTEQLAIYDNNVRGARNAWKQILERKYA